MKTYTLRLFRDCEQPLRVERLTAPSMDVAVGEARRRLGASAAFSAQDAAETSPSFRSLDTDRQTGPASSRR
jgi:hypothetical protein